MEKKRNIVEWAMHYRQIVILVTCCLVAFGIYSLPQMQKNEFPDFTIRQGMVIAVAPGNTVNEMVEQVTKPLEDYIFSYKEVKKEKTFSTTRDGIVFVQVELNDELNNKDEFWSKFKHGVQTFKAQLPSNVLAVLEMKYLLVSLVRTMAAFTCYHGIILTYRSHGGRRHIIKFVSGCRLKLKSYIL